MRTTLEIREMRPADLAVVMRIQAHCYTAATQESKESLGAKLSAAPSKTSRLAA